MRIKRALNKKSRHKKVLSQAKGYRLTYSKLYKRAKEALLHAGKYSYAHRKKRKGQFKTIWIERINAALQARGLKYGQFINSLKIKNIELNKKMLADFALNHAHVFDKVVEKSK